MPRPGDKLDDPPVAGYRIAMQGTAVPTFYLYGESHRAVAAGFIHVEPLDDRSRPSAWTIRPHAHSGLAQLFLLTAGGGVMQVEADVHRFEAPALLIVPSGVAHGFAWAGESAGWVLTTAQSLIADLGQRDPAIPALFAAACVARPDRAATAGATAALASLRRELGWSAPGHRAAVEGALLSLFATAIRVVRADAGSATSTAGRRSALVARFRARVEERFRRREPVPAHAAALGVSESRLRAACAAAAGASPAALLDARAMLEARRALLYSGLSVAEIGYALGFADPAYFSRFFARHEGCSPRTYREGHVPTPRSAAPVQRI